LDSYGQIVSVLSRIMLSLDAQDREVFSDCWSEDVSLSVIFFDGKEMKYSCRADLISGLTGSWEGSASQLRHQLGAVDVTLTGEADAEANYYCFYMTVGSTMQLAGMGQYWDQLTKGQDDKWRVARRKHVFLTPLVY